jgi:hypothetical protein
MRCDVEVNDPATLVRENYEDVENAKGEGGDGEEIDGGKLLGVVFQKCSPGLQSGVGASKNRIQESSSAVKC